MTAGSYFFNALSAMADLSPREITKHKKDRFKIELKYDVRNDDVASAWNDALLSVAESFDKNVEDKQFKRRLLVFKELYQNEKIEIDIAKDFSVDFLKSIIDSDFSNKHECSLGRIEAKEKRSYHDSRKPRL